MCGGKLAWDAIEHVIRAVKAIADDLTVGLVANLKSDSLAVDYPDSSIITEYFSENEASQILLALHESGFYTKLFRGEMEFIASVLDGSFEKLPRSRKLVYNTAQSGIGAGRKSLVPAFCALKGVNYCNSDAYTVSLARHKFHVYSILRSLGVPVAQSWLFDKFGWLFGTRPPDNIMLIAKACYESASIGLSEQAIGYLSGTYETMLGERTRQMRQPFIVQEFISGSEAEVPVFDFGEGAFALEPVAIALEGSRLLGDRILD
jgi:D-alanine-D-alanine ligase